jgi:hypothetical protein
MVWSDFLVSLSLHVCLFFCAFLSFCDDLQETMKLFIKAFLSLSYSSSSLELSSCFEAEAVAANDSAFSA